MIIVCPFSSGRCIVRYSLIYNFWLPAWYLQIFPISTTVSMMLLASEYLVVNSYDNVGQYSHFYTCVAKIIN